ncbi:MAG: chemotaxis protein CheX [Desulfobacteraceae bacterium]|nr:chemotaxis protein CheX [Desulfobacteraceae bacterium]
MEKAAMMKAMKASISNVLETMFYQMVQIVDDDCSLQTWFDQGQPLLGATLNFAGASEGTFYVIIPIEVANEITANFLGLDTGEIDAGQRTDTVKEALNMISGGMLSIFDPKGAVKLGIPEMIAKDDLSYDKLKDLQGDVILLETEDNRMAAAIAMD